MYLCTEKWFSKKPYITSCKRSTYIRANTKTELEQLANLAIPSKTNKYVSNSHRSICSVIPCNGKRYCHVTGDASPTKYRITVFQSVQSATISQIAPPAPTHSTRTLILSTYKPPNSQTTHFYIHPSDNQECCRSTKGN